MAKHIASQILKFTKEDWTSLSIYFGGSIGAIGGFSTGLVLPNDDFRRGTYSRTERTIQRSAFSLMGAVAGGLSGTVAMYTAPVWTPAAAIALLYDLQISARNTFNDYKHQAEAAETPKLIHKTN